MPASSELPLSRHRVVLTRASQQAEPLRRAFLEAGAEVVCLPLLEIVPPPDPAVLASAAARAREFAWIAFTSVNAVEAFLAADPPRPLPSLAAVGAATAAALDRQGCAATLVAEIPTAEGLGQQLGPRAAGQRVLLPQAADARPALAHLLSTQGAETEIVVAYDKRLPTAAKQQAEEIFGGGNCGSHGLGWVTFTSPRIVRHFRQLFGDQWSNRAKTLEALSIGPITSAELRTVGVERCHEAPSPSSQGLVQAMIEAL